MLACHVWWIKKKWTAINNDPFLDQSEKQEHPMQVDSKVGSWNSKPGVLCFCVVLRKQAFLFPGSLRTWGELWIWWVEHNSDRLEKSGLDARFWANDNDDIILMVANIYWVLTYVMPCTTHSLHRALHVSVDNHTKIQTLLLPPFTIEKVSQRG